MIISAGRRACCLLWLREYVMFREVSGTTSLCYGVVDAKGRKKRGKEKRLERNTIAVVVKTGRRRGGRFLFSGILPGWCAWENKRKDGGRKPERQSRCCSSVCASFRSLYTIPPFLRTTRVGSAAAWNRYRRSGASHRQLGKDICL